MNSNTVLARSYARSCLETTRRYAAGGLGTFQWMAPEVLAHQRYSEKADVYSFGVVLWECTARQARRPHAMLGTCLLVGAPWRMAWNAVLQLGWGLQSCSIAGSPEAGCHACNCKQVPCTGLDGSQAWLWRRGACMQVPHAHPSGTPAAPAVAERCLHARRCRVRACCGTSAALAMTERCYACAQVPYAGLNGIQAALAVMERRLHAPLTPKP